MPPTVQHRLRGLRHVGLVLLLLSVAATALAAGPGPQDLMEQTTERMLAMLRADRAVFEQDIEKLYAVVEEVVFPHVDDKRMARWALGKFWRRADAAQREAFDREFRRLILRTYAAALLAYDNQPIRFLPLRDSGDPERAVVRTEIIQGNAPPVPINYSLHLRDGAWMVYDLTIDGVSLLTNYRSNFATQIQREGMDDFLRALAERNRGAQPETPLDKPVPGAGQ